MATKWTYVTVGLIIEQTTFCFRDNKLFFIIVYDVGLKLPVYFEPTFLFIYYLLCKSYQGTPKIMQKNTKGEKKH